MAGSSKAKSSGSSSDKCSSEGCGHPKDQHADTGGGCWGDGTVCPCPGYARTKEEAEAVATAGTVDTPAGTGG